MTDVNRCCNARNGDDRHDNDDDDAFVFFPSDGEEGDEEIDEGSYEGRGNRVNSNTGSQNEEFHRNNDNDNDNDEEDEQQREILFVDEDNFSSDEDDQADNDSVVYINDDVADIIMNQMEEQNESRHERFQRLLQQEMDEEAEVNSIERDDDVEDFFRNAMNVDYRWHYYNETEEEIETSINAKVQFVKLCMRLSQNDPTLTHLDVDDGDNNNNNNNNNNENNEPNRHASNNDVDWSFLSTHVQWNDLAIVLLGTSLVGNTHLQSLALLSHVSSGMEHSHPVRQRECAMILAQGMAQSSIRRLTMGRLSYRLYENLIQHGIANMNTLRSLTLLDAPYFYFHGQVISTILLSTPPTTTTPVAASAFGLTHLRLRRCCVSDEKLLQIAIGLRHNSTLRSLDLEHNEITDSGIRNFCQEVFSDNPNTTDGNHRPTFLQELNVGSNQITSTGACTLIRAICDIRRLALLASSSTAMVSKLVLRGNEKIGYAGLQQIANEIFPSMNLIHLDLHNVVSQDAKAGPSHRAAAAACRALIHGLRRNTMLQELRLGNNGLFANHTLLRNFMEAVASHPTMRRLSLAADHTIGYEGLNVIGQVLPNLRLKEMDLAYLWRPMVTDMEAHRRERDMIYTLASSIASTNYRHKASTAAGRSLLAGVTNNCYLQQLECRSMDRMWLRPIRFYLDWNRTCRPLMMTGQGGGDGDVAPMEIDTTMVSPRRSSTTRSTAGTVPDSIWPHVLSRLHVQYKPSHVYFLLREQPWLVPASFV